MDPLERVKTNKDTSYFLMLAAEQRGHEVFYLNPSRINVDQGRVTANLTRVKVSEDGKHPFEVLSSGWEYLDIVDIVWIRTDPPVDRSYVYVTLLLDLLPSTVRVINRPSAIRDWNEKLSSLRYQDWIPRTLVARDIQSIEDFAKKFPRITIKPIDGHGGLGIMFAAVKDPGFREKIRVATNSERHWMIVQEYLEEAQEGDKRILLLNGQPLGAILRVHKKGFELNNLDQGGTAVASFLSDRDRAICAALKNDLRVNGIIFAGVDVIGGMLIEINITSPTGLQEMTRFDQQSYHHDIIKSLE